MGTFLWLWQECWHTTERSTWKPEKSRNSGVQENSTSLLLCLHHSSIFTCDVTEVCNYNVYKYNGKSSINGRYPSWKSQEKNKILLTWFFHLLLVPEFILQTVDCHKKSHRNHSYRKWMDLLFTRSYYYTFNVKWFSIIINLFYRTVSLLMSGL